jgi:hypothetical protein
VTARYPIWLVGLLAVMAGCSAAATTSSPAPTQTVPPTPAVTLSLPSAAPTPEPTPPLTPTPVPTEFVPYTLDEQTLHEGLVKYDCDKDGCWKRGSGPANTSAYYYPGLKADNAQIQAMLADVGLPATPVADDAEAWKRLWVLWDWFSRHGQYSDASDPTDAEKLLDSLSYKLRPARFPSISDFARVYAKYHVVPWANCTAASLTFLTFAYRVGLDPNRIATAFYQTGDFSIRHVFPIVRSGAHWYYIDAVCNVPGWTQTLPLEPANVGCVDNIDYVHPGSLGLLPGSTLKLAPLVR